MEAIIGVGSLIAEGIADVIGGTEIATSFAGALTTILDTLEEDGFAAIQMLMKGYSENDLFNIITSIGGEYPEIYLTKSLKVVGMSPSEALSNINIIGSKFAKKGIDIASTKGKQLFVDIVDQFGKIVKEHGAGAIANIGISGVAGYVGQKIAGSGYKDQNDNKIDYNNDVGRGEVNTLSTKS